MHDKMKLIDTKQLTINAYKALAKKYHNSFKDEMDQKPYDRQILDQFSKSIKPEGDICDAGCGPSGHIGKYLQKKGYKITGIDIFPECIEIAKSYEKDISFHCMDMMDTDFESEKFDGIISFYSIIHTPKNEIEHIIREFYRLLKPGGSLLLVVKKGHHEGVIKDDWFEGHPIYFAHFMENDLIDHLTENGMVIDFQETRIPYKSEIEVERIYMIAKKT